MALVGLILFFVFFATIRRCRFLVSNPSFRSVSLFCVFLSSWSAMMWHRMPLFIVNDSL